MAYVTVVVTGDKEWHENFLTLARRLSAKAIEPSFEILEKKLMNTLKTLFAPSSGGMAKGKTYAHGYTGKYAAGLRSKTTGEKLIIYETVSKGGKHIQEGVGPRMLPGTGVPVVSVDVVNWALNKLGVTQSEAFAISKSVSRHGIGWSGGKSPLQAEMPTGQGKFDYPEWTVTVKNKRDIESAAEKIGWLAVSYLER